jgi:hypothetical protein
MSTQSTYLKNRPRGATQFALHNTFFQYTSCQISGLQVKNRWTAKNKQYRYLLSKVRIQGPSKVTTALSFDRLNKLQKILESSIAARQFLILYCDKPNSHPLLHTGLENNMSSCSKQCCQVLRRLFRQLNQNLPLVGENTPLFKIFIKFRYFSAIFWCFPNC